MEIIDLKSCTLEELKEQMKAIGEAEFRAKQIYGWLHSKMAVDFEDMTNLSKALRQKLKDHYKISYANIVDKLVSAEDNTTKYLFECENNCIIESVLMRYSYGNAVCVSTQAGCNMGCKFCASTIGGKDRDLTAGEILSQVYEIQKDSGEKVSSIVLMGSGEPLDNYNNVLQFIRMINSKEGMNIGQRHITLSTCGLVDQIYALAEENLQITLAVSLHAPNDEIRTQTMPIARRYPMEELLAACKKYADSTKRRVTFEYALIRGVNDSMACARELAGRLHHMLCHVNLIPINDVKERNFEKSSADAIKRFADYLNSQNIETTVRRELGSDINAACGQLRRGYLEK